MVSSIARYLIAVLLFSQLQGIQTARSAQSKTRTQSNQKPEQNNIHPPVLLKDSQGKPLLGPDLGGQREPNAAASCNGCHDVLFIQTHSTHEEHINQSDCFVCHTIGDKSDWGPSIFDPEGRLKTFMATPDNTACGQCHGLVSAHKSTVELDSSFFEADMEGPFGMTLKTGEIFSSQRVMDSFLNLANKSGRTWAWDVHMERGLLCTSCHFSPNNPKRISFFRNHIQGHLKFDPRALGTAAFLKQPSHELKTAACNDCHDAHAVHQSLERADRHLNALSCQACHVAKISAPAIQALDWTVLTLQGRPIAQFRGVRASHSKAINTWYTDGFEPFLLEEQTPKGMQFAPYNMVAEWYWASGKEKQAVSKKTLEQAWFLENGSYRPEILQIFDNNQDGLLGADELQLKNQEQVRGVKQLLENIGILEPQIVGVVRAFPVRHNVMQKTFSTQECTTCHASSSRFNQSILLSTKPLPGGVMPQADEKTTRLLGNRTLVFDKQGLRMDAQKSLQGRYVIGHVRSEWSEWLGYIVFVLTMLGVFLHGGLRHVAHRRQNITKHVVTLKRVYMYGMYERFWHWTMAFSVIALAITGLQLHYPDQLSFMQFSTAVFVHNLMALVLVANAFLSLFFHVTTGQIRHFIPSRKGLLQRIALQSWYYAKGIFIGAMHPIPKTPEIKLNPLQQLTYVALLNVLFPLQIITGLFLWVGGKEASMAGPFHYLFSWLFLSFLFMHVYLTTTGRTPLSNLKAMIDGWEEVDVLPDANRTGEKQ